MNQVTLYSSSVCGYCVQAKRLLARRGIVPVEINVDFDNAKRAEMMQRTGRRTVPQIFIGEQHVGGYDDLAALERDGKLDALLPFPSTN
jgi:glutaredoxin 3